MEIFNHAYKSISTLNHYIDDNLNKNYKSLLIQVFTGDLNKKELQEVLDNILIKLPNANIIGASSAGEIMDGKMYDEQIIISFTLFDKTDINTFYTPIVDFQSGEKMAAQIVKPNTKAIVCFSESMKGDPQNFFKGFDKKTNILIAGGNASDNGKLKKTFIIKDSIIYDYGMVLCTLNSNELIVNNEYTLNWAAVGKEMIITKAVDNVVYEINDRPVLDIFKYYLGAEIELKLPESIIEFPLLKYEKNIDIARSLVAVNDDKSFVFAGHFSVGDKVRFGIGNIHEIINNGKLFCQEVSQYPCEGIYIYSSMVRKKFLNEQLKDEFSLLGKIAANSGFFTYGEFFNTGLSNQVLNITTTVLALSETEKINEINNCNFSQVTDLTTSTLKSLTNLVNVTELELEDQIELLQNAKDQLIESEKMASLGALVSGISHEVNTPLGVGMTGITQIIHELKKVEKSYNEDNFTEKAFKQYLSTMSTLSSTIHSSLENAVNLVKSFKKISIDQHSGESRVFNLKDYVNDTIRSLSSQLKINKVNVINNIDDDIELESFPGVYSQIFSNLILNSIKHAFDSNNENQIEIYSEKKDNLYIHFKDNGKGIGEGMQKKIFDPFFTTARGQGGSGLGLNIVYNLVTQKLNGEIKVIEDKKSGLHFEIKIKQFSIKEYDNG